MVAASLFASAALFAGAHSVSRSKALSFLGRSANISIEDSTPAWYEAFKKYHDSRSKQDGWMSALKPQQLSNVQDDKDISWWDAVGKPKSMNLADDSECLPAGGLLYLHIMKNYGTSIEAYLECSCRLVGCGVKLSLGPVDETKGHPTCKDKHHLCSTHGRYADREELCGPEFAEPAKTMTVLRDPVDRVFSFYNFYVMLDLIDMPLVDMLTCCQTLDCKASVLSFCPQLSNHMVQTIFASKDDVNPHYPFTDEQLQHAKEQIAGLDAVFIIDNADKFVEHFKESHLLPQEDACQLPHANPTACPKCAAAPTEAERELITKMNFGDINLFEYAKKLTNRFQL